MQKIISRACILVGVALLLAGCAMLANNMVRDYRAGRESQQLLEQLLSRQNQAQTDNQPSGDTAPSTPDTDTTSPEGSIGENENGERAYFIYYPPGQDGAPFAGDSDTSEEGAAGASGGESGRSYNWQPSYSIIGVIYIARLNIRLPVIGEYTDALLNISPCRISGLVTGKPNRLVIAGHNLRSHFKGLDTLILGDEVTFTTVDDVTFRYEVIEVTSLHKSQGAEVHAVDGWDLTLLTCKTDRTMRTMVRCAEILEEPIESAPNSPGIEHARETQDESAELPDGEQQAGDEEAPEVDKAD